MSKKSQYIIGGIVMILVSWVFAYLCTNETTGLQIWYTISSALIGVFGFMGIILYLIEL